MVNERYPRCTRSDILKIKYNGRMTESDKFMFDFAKEFVFRGLEQKQIFDKLTLDLRKYSSKKYGLSRISVFEVYKESEFVPKISLYGYGIKLLFNAYVLSGYKCIETLEQYKYLVFFHELAHLIYTYNLDPIEYERYLNTRESIFDQKEEDNANEIAIRFMLDQGIIEDGGILKNEINGEEKWWKLVLYRR